MSTVTIKAKDGSGTFSAYIARPKAGHGPVIVAIQEIFGVNGFMRQTCDHLAEQGYIAISPDLFWRQEPGVDLTDKTEAEWKKAFAYMNGFDPDKGIEDIAATIDFARTVEGANGKVGAVGYCLGGMLSYLTAARTDADACVSYYGVNIDKQLKEAENIKKPLMLHIAGQDQFVPKEAQDAIIAGLENYDHIETFRYNEQDHAFARNGGKHWDEAAATLANSRTASFFSRFL